MLEDMRYLACVRRQGTFDMEMVITKNLLFSLCTGHGWGPGRSGQGQTNPGPAEWAGGAGRGPGPPADQEHICYQVCYRACFHWAPILGSRTLLQLLGKLVALYILCCTSSTYLPRQGSVIPFLLSQSLTYFSYSPPSYINQRNREWNIVESEKALVVSKTTLSGSLKIISINKMLWNLVYILFRFIFWIVEVTCTLNIYVLSVCTHIPI